MVPIKNPTRTQIFTEASKNLRQDLERAKSIPHHGERGKEVENILKNFLKEHLPKRYDVASGFILDRADNVSPQTDVIVYDASSCPIFETYEDNLIIPSDNAAAVIEVKSNLTKKDIEDAAEKIANIKSLNKSAIDLPPGPWNLNTIGILFAFKSSLSLETIGTHYKNSIAKHKLGRHIDYIFVLDEGMLSINAHLPGDPGFAPIMLYSPNSGVNGTVLVVGGTKFKEKTVDQFIRYLLPHLQFFWPWISHPGFDNRPSEDATGEKVFGSFLTVKLDEEDPKKRQALAEEYKRKFAEGTLT
ncbi:MAG TPA: DUF6602 domain-containing protein [Patescibacteria group bacterium]|nr:DUF6602 domain-containing protein [Patescibacteria group bacterium]